MAAIGRVTALVLECSDARALAAFWSRVLDLEVIESDAEPGWVTLGRTPERRLCFQEVDGYTPPEWPGETGEQQMHLDVLVEDLPGAARAVVALEATPLTDVLDPDDGEWQIFADPAGHPFCLVTTPE